MGTIVIKFGGKSLANGTGLNNVLRIIKNKQAVHENLVVVVSARGNTTDQLEGLLETAKQKKGYTTALNNLKKEQLTPCHSPELEQDFTALEDILKGVSYLGDYSPKIKDEVLAQGELFAAKQVAKLLVKEGIKANFVDSRKLIITDSSFGDALTLEKESQEKVLDYFNNQEANTVNVVTGFIAANTAGETTTLGRNGSNYTASLLANYLNASEFQNYTHVDGIFTANPDLVADAQKIEQLSFNEANELANFGASILHAKTILPLVEKGIPLRILNTFNTNDNGTIITKNNTQKGIKSISVLDDVSLVTFEGRGLLGKVGIDARIFNALSNNNISVSIISQGSSERGIGLVIKTNRATDAILALEKEFETDFYKRDVNKISVLDDVVVISIIGQELNDFHKPFNALIKNQITPLLFNNTITGKNVSIIVKKNQLNKAVNVIHGQIFGVAKKINIVIFGKGLVGGTLINQILSNTKAILKRRQIQLNIVAVASSKKVLLNKNGVSENWKIELEQNGIENYTTETIIEFAEKHHLENLIAVDNTASAEFIQEYIPLIKAGFDLVSSNKIANTSSNEFYIQLREVLKENNKQYLYETNVGAGLPLIDTIKLLHHSGEDIVKIKGVFSGSLSYLFNTFSTEDRPFSEVLQEAIDKGFTEPDPREDLCGNDVARKLLILARELDLVNELSDVNIKNLIPEPLRAIDTNTFLQSLDELNAPYQELKSQQKSGNVLRYIGELSGDLSKSNGAKLDVKLVFVPNNSALGSLKGSDSIFEIYTKSYGENPLVIQGAGAGAAVTARGVFGDILRLIEKS
ncbi:MAG: bifunctional aspartate kinase/homoserine dehydrogenase I [Flavobacteriaceae bacterium]|nr:bifunctional aspartate kinase/homoserine dehydrogenase I [Flavobacteriaceae bacterium]